MMIEKELEPSISKLKRRETTISWLSTHTNPRTGEPFLNYANQKAAETFAMMCDQVVKGYKTSRWDSYVDCEYREPAHINSRQMRKTLMDALKTLGNDAQFTADIVVKNMTLRDAEQKHKISRGKAKKYLRVALDRLVNLFGYEDDDDFFDDYDERNN